MNQNKSKSGFDWIAKSRAVRPSIFQKSFSNQHKSVRRRPQRSAARNSSSRLLPPRSSLPSLFAAERHFFFTLAIIGDLPGVFCHLVSVVQGSGRLAGSVWADREQAAALLLFINKALTRSRRSARTHHTYMFVYYNLRARWIFLCRSARCCYYFWKGATSLISTLECSFYCQG
jgi:hypothetical protein